MRAAKDGHLYDLLYSNSGKLGTIWSTLKTLTKSKAVSSISLRDKDDNEVTDPRLVAKQFNDYFADAVEHLNVNNDFMNEQHPVDSNACDLDNQSEPVLEQETKGRFELPTLTSQYVADEINQLGLKKATGPDDISCRVFKMVTEIPKLLNSLTYIYNLSLVNGVLPDAWKNARIQPIHKSGSKNEVHNYRPMHINIMYFFQNNRKVCTQASIYFSNYQRHTMC